MSYDVYLEIDTGRAEPWSEWIGNYTSNAAPMWRTALPPNGIAALDGVPCSEAAGPLAQAVERMAANPHLYTDMNPSNGWGNYEGALAYLRKIAEAVAENSKCTIRVSR